jgi:hypothetical protein
MLWEGTTNPSAAATSSNPTTELTDSSLIAHNIEPKTVDINRSNARNAIAEALDEHNQEKGGSETCQEQNEERGEPIIHQDQLPITSELFQTPLSLPTEEQTDSLLTFLNDSSQGLDEFFAEHSERANLRDFQGDSVTRSERSKSSLNEAEEIAARRSPEYFPENVPSNSNLNKIERSISDGTLSIEAEQTDALTHELQQPSSSSTLHQPSLDSQVTPTAQENFQTDRTNLGDLKFPVLDGSVSETQEALESLDEFNVVEEQSGAQFPDSRAVPGSVDEFSVVEEPHSTQSLDSQTVSDSLAGNNALSNQSINLADRQGALDSQPTPNQVSSEMQSTDFEAVPSVDLDADRQSSPASYSDDFIAQDDLALPDESFAVTDSSFTQSSDATVAPESLAVDDLSQMERKDPSSTPSIYNTSKSEDGLLNWLSRGVSWVKSKLESAEIEQNSARHRDDLSQAVSQPEIETDVPEGSKAKPQNIHTPIEKEPINPSTAMDDLENAPQPIRGASETVLAEDACVTYPEERSQIFLSPPESVFNRASTEASEQPIQDSATTPSAFRDLGAQASEAIVSEVSEDLQAQSDTNQLPNNDVDIPNPSNILEFAASDLLSEQQLKNASQDPSTPIQEDVVELDWQVRVDPDHSVVRGSEQSSQAVLGFSETDGADDPAPISPSDAAEQIDAPETRYFSFEGDNNQVQEGQEKAIASGSDLPLAENPSSSNFSTDSSTRVEIELESALSTDAFINPGLTASGIEERSILQSVFNESSLNFATEETFDSDIDSAELVPNGESVQSSESVSIHDKQAEIIQNVEALSQEVSPDGNAVLPEAVDTGTFLQKEPSSLINQGCEHSTDCEEETSHPKPLINSTPSPFILEERTILQPIPDESDPNFRTEGTFDSDIDSAELFPNEGNAQSSESSVSTRSVPTQDEQADLIQSEASRTNVEALSQEASPGSSAVLSDLAHEMGHAELSLQPLTEQVEIATHTGSNLSPQQNETYPTTDGVSSIPEKFSNPEASESQSHLPSDEGSTHDNASTTPVDTGTFIQEVAFSSMSQGGKYNPDPKDETSDTVQLEESTSALEEVLNTNPSVSSADSPPLHSNVEAGDIVENCSVTLDEPQSLSHQSETTAQSLSLDPEQSTFEDNSGFEFNRQGIEAQTIIQTIADVDYPAFESDVTPLTSTEQISQLSFNPLESASQDVPSLAEIESLKAVQDENVGRPEVAQAFAQGQANQAESISLEKKTVNDAPKDIHPEVSPEFSAGQPVEAVSSPKTIVQPPFQNEQDVIAFEIDPNLVVQQIETHTAFDNLPEKPNNEEVFNPTSFNTAANATSIVEPIDSASQDSGTLILDGLSSTAGQDQSLHNEPSSIADRNSPQDPEPVTFILDELSSPEKQAPSPNLSTGIEPLNEFLEDDSRLLLEHEAFEKESVPQPNLLNQDFQNPNPIPIGLDEPLHSSSSRDAETSSLAQNKVQPNSPESPSQAPEALNDDMSVESSRPSEFKLLEKAVSASTINVSPSEDSDPPRLSADSEAAVSVESLVNAEQSVVEIPQAVDVAHSEIEALTQPQTVADGLSPKIEARLTDFQSTQKSSEHPSLEGDWTDSASQDSQSHADLESSASSQNRRVNSSQVENAPPEVILGLDELPNDNMASSSQLKPQPERRAISTDADVGVDIKPNLFTQQVVNQNPTVEMIDRSSEILRNDETLDLSANLEADIPFVNDFSDTPSTQIPLEPVTFIQDNPLPMIDGGVEQEIVREDATSNASQGEQLAPASKEQSQIARDLNDSPSDNLPFPSDAAGLEIFQGTEQFGVSILDSPSEYPVLHQNESKEIAPDSAPISKAQTFSTATSSNTFTINFPSSTEEPHQPSPSKNTVVNSNPALLHIEEQTILQVIPDASSSSPQVTTQEPLHPAIDASESIQQDWENVESKLISSQNQQAESIQWENGTNVNAEASSQNLPTAENSTLSDSPHGMLDLELSAQPWPEQSAISENTEPSPQTQRIEVNPPTDEVFEVFTNHNADESQSDIHKDEYLKHNDTLATPREEPVTFTQDVSLAPEDWDVEQSSEYRDKTSYVSSVELSTPASEKAEIQTPHSIALEDQTELQVARPNISPTLQATERHYAEIEVPSQKQNELTENVEEYPPPSEINDVPSDINSEHRQSSIQPSTNEIVNEENISSDWAIVSSPLAQDSGLLSHLSLSDFIQQNSYDQMNGDFAVSVDEIKTSDIRIKREDFEENMISVTTFSKFDADLNTENISAKLKSNPLDERLPIYWNNLEELVGSNTQKLNVIDQESCSETQKEDKRMPDSWSNLEELVNSSSNQFGGEPKINISLNEIHAENSFNGWSDLSSLIRSLTSVGNDKIPAELLDTNTKVNDENEEIKKDLFYSKEDFLSEPQYLPSRNQFIQLVVNEVQVRSSCELEFLLPAKILLDDKEAWVTSQSKYPAPLDFSLIEETYERLCSEPKFNNLNLIISDLVESISKISRRENKDFSFYRKYNNLDMF